MANDLLTNVPRPPAALASVECRVHVRYSCALPAACRPTSEWRGKEDQWPATLTDVSHGGIRLVLRRRFEAGSKLSIELPSRKGEEVFAVIARVVHVRACPGGHWALGCRFLGELTDDELSHLVPSLKGQEAASEAQTPADAAPPVAPSRADKLILTDVRFQIEAREGKLLQFLVRRLNLSGSQRPVPGKTLTIQMANSGGPRRVFRAQVVRWDREGNDEVLRLRFLRPTPAPTPASPAASSHH